MLSHTNVISIYTAAPRLPGLLYHMFLGIASNSVPMLFFKAVCVLALILSRYANIIAASPPHFQQWFHQYSLFLQSTLQDACSRQYQDYYLNVMGAGCDGGPKDPPSCNLAGRVVDCLLSHITESTKANFASAAVLLGLMPTTLTYVGSNTAETALLALRRPILALLLAGGSPTVSPFRTFEYGNLDKLLSKTPIARPFPHLSPGSAVAVVLVEYVFAGIAIINLVHVSWQLSNFAVCSFSPETAYMPLLWAVLALKVHLFNSLATRFCVSLEPAVGSYKTEFQLNARLQKAQLKIQPESYQFIICSWMTSTTSVLHILFGTVVFSSTLFIGTQDAAYIVLRFIASAVFCRIVLMLELRGMRGVVELKHDLNDHSSSTELAVRQTVEV